MIYIVQAENTGWYKIGCTNSELSSRISMLQTGSPHKLVIVASLEGSFLHEAYIHNLFSIQRGSGEWFNLSQDNLTALLDPSWYREHVLNAAPLSEKDLNLVRDIESLTYVEDN